MFYADSPRESIAIQFVWPLDPDLAVDSILSMKGDRVQDLHRDVFKVRAFAELAGVTVRALHHDDRLALLRPKRTRAGYPRQNTGF